MAPPPYLHPCLAAAWLPSPPPAPVPCQASVDQLWMGYLSIGGFSSLDTFADVLADRAPESPGEHDLVVQTLNEHLLKHGYRFPIPYLHPAHDDGHRR